jgi:hypothetical protein
VEHKIAYGNVWIAARCIDEATAMHLFTGFDEVWLYEEAPHFDLSCVHGSTSESTDFSKELPVDTAEAIVKTKCRAALGDGCGLNYVTTDQDLAVRIEEVASDQR